MVGAGLEAEHVLAVAVQLLIGDLVQAGQVVVPHPLGEHAQRAQPVDQGADAHQVSVAGDGHAAWSGALEEGQGDGLEHLD